MCDISGTSHVDERGLGLNIHILDSVYIFVFDKDPSQLTAYCWETCKLYCNS